VIFLEEEYRAFCPTGEGGGVKNDCSSGEPGGAGKVKADSSWKREQGTVVYKGDELKESPPAKSLAGVSSVVIVDGELVNKSLREIGVTLDQAARACAAVDHDSQVTIGHGGMRALTDFMTGSDPERWIEDTVTVISSMPIAGVQGAAQTAVSLSREENDDLVMSYTMLMVSEKARQASSVAIARQMMKGTVSSIVEAEKIGVDRIEMLAAGSSRHKEFSGYRIWPRLGFDGVIPRGRITPTWSLAKGFFSSYGSGLSDRILSPRARKEKAAGALTIQALYETKEGQEWWEKNGGEMEMSLKIGSKSPGWKRFQAIRQKFSKRGLDLADAFFDVECRGILDEAWAEVRAYCPTGEGGGIDNSCSPGEQSPSASPAKVDKSWQDSQSSVLLSGSDLKDKPPYAGADKATSVDIPDPQSLQGGMAQAGIKSLDHLATMGGATVRGSKAVFSGAGHPDFGAYISVENEIPLSRDGDPSEGHFNVNIAVYKEGREHVLGLNGMHPSPEVNATPQRVARATSLMQQAVIEAMLAADDTGLSRIKMSAAGGPEYDLKGYRLWPQFGFDAELENTQLHAISQASPQFVEKLMRAARPDLFATRYVPPHAALVAALPRSKITVQHLISFHEGDVWWNENGSTLSMSIDLNDKKSLGYARFQKQAARLKRLKSRNQSRAFFEWLDEQAEFRAGADCGRAAGGRFGAGNDCAADENEGGSSWEDEESVDMDAEAISSSPPFKGAEVLDSFAVNDVQSLKDTLSDFGRVRGVEDVVAISGGVRPGGSVSIDAFGESVIVNSSIPVAPDGSGRLGNIENMVSLMKDDDGNLVVNYDSMSLDSAAMSSISGDLEDDSADRRRIVSLVLERMTDSLSVAEKSGAIRADTIAAGTSTSALQGYRLWPQFGFDGPLDRADIDTIKEDVKLTPQQKRKANAGAMTVQDLIATPEGDRWWNENGTTIELTLDFTDQTTAGYKRFERMKKMLARLKERNKTRSAFDDGVEHRDDCEQTESGQFAKGNDCAKGDGSPSKEKEKKPRAAKKAESPSQEPLKWTPGASHVDVFKESVEKSPTKRSDDGKKILSTSIPGATPVRGLAGKDEIDPISVGNYLVARQAEHRGRTIDTTKPLEGDDFEYMVSGIVSQVESARARGVSPNFYSPEDRRAQIEEYAKIQPLMRGGRTASGFCVGVETPSGECEPSEGISPQAEFLFRAAQALTSPEANPYENMLRADAVLTAFFEEPDPSKAKLGSGIRIAGAGAENTLANFARLQKIIDRVGLEEARRIFTGPPIKVSDFEKFFLSKVPGTEGDRYKANDYAVAEVVPPFSIFGPKVGPFFANNTGDDEALTADIWFTRTWGRLSGELVSKSSESLAKKHASDLMASTKDIPRKELTAMGLDGRQFRTLVAQMKRTGAIPQQIADWAEARDKQYKKDKFPHPDKGTGTAERYKLDRLAVAILKNQANVMRAPTTSVMRANMIRAMREAAQRTGVSVAYMQDILWQDEQDAWGTLGSRTTTVPGEPSLYSEVIRKIVTEPANYQKRRRESKRSLGVIAEPMSLPLYSDQKGGPEQALFADFIASMDDDEFADLAVEFLTKRAKESRAFCPTGDGGGIKNDCNSSDGGVLKSAVARWKGFTSEIDLHLKDELSGRPAPQSASGAKMREQAKAILREVIENGEPAPTLYRGDDKPPSDNDSTLLGWTSDKQVAEKWAKKYGGQVYTLKNATGLDLSRFGSAGDGTDDFQESEWIVLNNPPKKSSRAFCPTGDGGGVDNSCGSDDGSPAAGSPGRTQESLPKSFPRGSDKFRDAIDSVSPDPKSVWDRAKGRADTPPEKILTSAADEQTSSGSSLTPEAEKSYADLVDEIGRQYEALVAAGLKAKAWRGDGEPYGDPPGSTKPNSDKMREEVAKTGEFSFFMTERGFGTGSATPDHPMLRETKYKTADGEPMIANDLFRVVHDMVAHVRGGYSFSTNGEYNGMLTHASTLPESAWPALFAETFGQNAVYEKTGNYAAQNAYASKIGPEIIKAELAKRKKKSSRAEGKGDGDEPLGYQHIKVRPWLMQSPEESRAFCPTGDGGGVKNDCSSKDGGSSGDAVRQPSWMGKVDATGSTKHGKWFLEQNTKGNKPPGRDEAASHVVSLLDDKSKVKAFVHVDLSSDKKALYVHYSEVSKPFRGQGAYKSLLDSMSEQFDVISDEEHNVAPAAKKAYESLGARLNRYGRYVLEKNRRNARAFCPTGEGGGVDNSCSADDSPGQATASPGGDRWSSSESLTWPETSRDSSSPPLGDGRYGSINISAPKTVKSSLDAAGIDPKLAPMVAGGSEDSDVFVRPAPDFSMEFPDSKVTPVMFAFERDFAGVGGGLHGSSVIGVTAAGETVVYHSTVNVADAIKGDDAKRHAAAREFYRAMVSSVEAARKSGVSRIVLNAAGNSSATKGGVTATPWRGYTIWPRMGFDAPLPASIKSKLPPDLSHAKSLLDLHATPEGTRWWRDNGEDLDVTFDLKDRSSPQSKIMDRFIKKFGTDRREMPLGSGDEWLSPEDMLRLDEMWNEIWDDGELDDYEWVESRSADCGRDDDGRFGPKNDCQDKGSGQESPRPSKGAYSDAANPLAIKRVREHVDRGNAKHAAEDIAFLMESMPPSEVAKQLGFTSFDIDGSFDRDASKKPGFFSFLTGDPAKSAANHLAKLALAAKHAPGLKDSSFNFSKFNATVDTFAAEAGITSIIEKIRLAASMVGAKAACNLKNGEITVIQDRADDEKSLSRAYDRGWFSTDDPSHYVLHEYAHKLQHDVIASWAGGKDKVTSDFVGRFRNQVMDAISAIHNNQYFRADHSQPKPPAGASKDMLDRAMDVSMYGMTDPLEFLAEYWTGVTLGYVRNDEQFDEVFKAVDMKPPRKSDAAQSKYGESGIADRRREKKKRK
jgi:hypothetical protein